MIFIACEKDHKSTTIDTLNPTYYDTVWLLYNADSSGVIIEVNEYAPFTVSFNDSVLSGSDGCNLYSGMYHANERVLTVHSLNSTLMECNGKVYPVDKIFSDSVFHRIESGILIISQGPFEYTFKTTDCGCDSK